MVSTTCSKNILHNAENERDWIQAKRTLYRRYKILHLQYWTCEVLLHSNRGVDLYLTCVHVCVWMGED